MLRSVLLLFFISSCSFLKGTPSLKTIDTDRLLNSIKLTGEGKGRLTLGQSQHVFSVDSVLNEDLDWIFAVSIPLHGEEVMILSDIKSHQMKFSEVSSFEERIAKEFQRLKLNKILTTEKFMKELRLLIRFGLSPQWGQKRDCKPQQNETVCELDGEKFIVHVLDTEIKIIFEAFFGIISRLQPRQKYSDARLALQKISGAIVFQKSRLELRKRKRTRWKKRKKRSKRSTNVYPSL
jgi:hypothetical protein